MEAELQVVNLRLGLFTVPFLGYQSGGVYHLVDEEGAELMEISVEEVAKISQKLTEKPFAFMNRLLEFAPQYKSVRGKLLKLKRQHDAVSQYIREVSEWRIQHKVEMAEFAAREKLMEPDDFQRWYEEDWLQRTLAPIPKRPKVLNS